MKITLTELRRLIKEETRSYLEHESSVPGSWDPDGSPLDPKDASRLGPGVWPGWDDDLEEEDNSISVSEEVMKEIVLEGIMLAEFGVLEQFELDVDTINESVLEEAKYKGREVKLGKPMRGDRKKYKVYVKDPKTGNVKKVEFGDPNMEIKRDDPARRRNFRARHGCGTPRASDRTKAAYWSCRMWSKKPVSKILKGK